MILDSWDLPPLFECGVYYSHRPLPGAMKYTYQWSYRGDWPWMRARGERNVWILNDRRAEGLMKLLNRWNMGGGPWSYWWV